ncbi:MAG: hypothetical protein KGD63_04380 [Candidatus Lokiarchaeota archaeon]|nr:hypothetical protein [Candidatus Lokiarchaeota archaeon]
MKFKLIKYYLFHTNGDKLQVVYSPEEISDKFRKNKFEKIIKILMIKIFKLI